MSQVPRARPERGSDLQGLPMVEAGSQVSPLHTWAQVSLRPGLCWRADPAPCLPCIISLASYLLCAGVIPVKQASKIPFLFGAPAPTLGDKASLPEGGLGFWGLVQTSSKGGGERGRVGGWGTGFGLHRFSAGGSFGLCLWPFPVMAAAWETAAAFPWPCSGTSKPPCPSLDPLGFEVGLFLRLNPEVGAGFQMPLLYLGHFGSFTT